MTPPDGTKFLPPDLAMAQKIGGEAPRFPEELRLPGRTYVVNAKICVSTAGLVDNVSIVEASDPTLATNVANVVKDWRYHPLVAKGTDRAFPFCYVMRLLFKSA